MDYAGVTVSNLGGFGPDDTSAAQMLKFEDVNYKNGNPQNYFNDYFSPARPTQVDLEIKTAPFKVELPIHEMFRDVLTTARRSQPSGRTSRRIGLKTGAASNGPPLASPPRSARRCSRLPLRARSKSGDGDAPSARSTCKIRDDRRAHQGGLLPVLLQAR